jgi:hypothetical protein
MLYIESFVHRVRLAEVVSRWVVNRPRPEDARRIKEIVNFNSYIARIWVDRLATSLLEELWGKTPKSFACKTKGQLKDFLVQNPRYTTPRIDELVSRYRAFPEDYYRDSPLDGRVYFAEESGRQVYVGSTRIKRFRRIAEKGSRQIVDYMYERIRSSADALAEERARRLGIAKDQLITPQEEQVAEFMRAERRLLEMIRQGEIQNEFPILSIPDVVGIKLIAEGSQYDQLLESLRRDERCKLLEVEHHTGRYNAINMRVAYTIPRELLAARPPVGRVVKIFNYRGFNSEDLVARYQTFLDSAEDHVLLEIIVSDYPEFLESEIGRSMHEERIFEQRSKRDYNSHLATNVLFLMDLILSLCLSPYAGPVTDVPIKLWVKYMPDTLDRLVRRLYNIPADASFDDHGELIEQGWQPVLGRPIVSY